MKYCALVTGASRGIGKAIAIQLSKDLGLHLLINYASNKDAAQKTLDEIQTLGGSGELMPFDVADKTSVSQVVNEWQKTNPDYFISVLVNNAGITRDTWFMWMKEEDWDQVINVSLKGMFNVSQAVIRQMLVQKQGRIINITSVSGLKGVAGQVNYSAAKAGIIGATKALAQEAGPKNITVNAVAPGFIDTDMLENMKADMDQFLPSIPAGRTGTPEEVAHLVSFLASDKASYINGEVININGGLYS